MRKPRSDSKLLNLAEEQQSQLQDWMMQGLSYGSIKELCEKELAIKTSYGALHNYWSEVGSTILLMRRQQALTVASDIAVEAERNPGQFNAATIDALKQKAFELAVSPQSSAGDVKNIFTLLIKSRTNDLKSEELKLRQKEFQVKTCELFLKWAEDQRAASVLAGSDSNSDKINKLGQLMFGEEW